MGEKIIQYSYYLFSRNSFINGMGRIFDFNSIYNSYNYSKDSQEADLKALYLDWSSVGQDICLAMRNYEQKQ